MVAIDNLDEIDRLERSRATARSRCCCASSPRSRPTPTHAVATGHADQKFGLTLAEAAEAVDRLNAAGWADVRGVHAHIGSQLFDLAPYREAVAAIAELGPFPVYDLGGGLAAAYTPEHRPPSVDEWVAGVTGAAHELLGAREAELWIEPGRALVANAGVTLYTVESVKRRDSTWVAVDGGMSDNLRPMLYGAPYTADVADRLGSEGEPGERCHLAGKHCESGDVIAWDVRLRDPRPGRRHRHARRRAPTGTRWPTTTTACRGRRSSSAPAARRGWRCGARHWRTSLPETFRVGLLGHGTVGSAFEALLAERADAIASIIGARPELSGVLTRSRGSFEEILEGSDLVVELIGGLDPAREYVLRAMQAGKHVVSANKQLLSHHGEELWATAREHGVQLRFEGAVAGVVPVIRVLQESLAAARIERVHGIVNGTTNYILSEMAAAGISYEEALGQAQALGYAEADPTDDVTGKDAAAKMAILARLAFSTPVHLDQVRYEGIEQITADDMAYAQELGLGLKLIGTAERIDGGINVRVHPAFLYAEHPLASVHGPFNAVTVESDAITEITLSGPGAGGPQTASAVLGDVISAMIPPATTPETTDELPFVTDVSSAFYLHLEVADRPGVLAQVAEILGMQGASVKSVVQEGLGDNARLVMVLHPLLESRLYGALRLIGQLEFMRSPPRAIRVIDEEFS